MWTSPRVGHSLIARVSWPTAASLMMLDSMDVGGSDSMGCVISTLVLDLRSNAIAHASHTP